MVIEKLVIIRVHDNEFTKLKNLIYLSFDWTFILIYHQLKTW